MMGRTKIGWMMLIVLFMCAPHGFAQPPDANGAVQLTEEEIRWIETRQPVRVGVHPGFPPFIFQEDGVWKGTHIDYLDRIAERTGLRFELASEHSSTWEKQALNGEIDMFPSLDVPGRRERLNLTRPFMEYKLVIITRLDTPFISGVGALKGRTVAVIKGGKLCDIILGEYPSIKKYEVNSILEALKAVSAGRADALVSGVLLTTYLIQDHHLANLKIAGIADYPSEELMFAVRKDLPELLGVLNKAIAAITPEERNAILRKWFPIEVSYRADWTEFIQWVGVAGAFFIIILGLSLYWNRRLALEVYARKKSEKRLKESADRFQAMFDQHQAAMYLIDPQNGHIVDANQAAVQLYGYPRTVMKQMTIYQINQLSNEEISVRLASAKNRETNRFIFPHRLAGGKVRDMEIHSSPIPFQGKTILFSIVHDVTDRRRAEKALRRSEARYRTLIETLPHGVEENDLEGRITFSNHAHHKMLGYEPNELTGKYIWDCLPHGPEELQSYLARLVEEQPEPTIYISKNRTLDGRLIDVQVDWNYQRDEQGRLIGFVSVITDVTERNRAEKELKAYSERLEEMVEGRTAELKKTQAELLLKERLAVLGHFAGSISHELRNPLGVIDGSAYFLKMKLSGADDKIKAHLGRIQDNVSQSTAIIQSLLDLSRMEKPKVEPAALADLISGAIGASKLPEAVKTVLDLPDPPVFVDIDPEQMRMALKNIIQNAAQAMEGSGTLAISAGVSASGEAAIAITDTGPGIAPEQMEKVFEPLFSTKTHGIGFGLSIVRMIVEKHGGSIRAEAPAEGGARFVITIPQTRPARF